MGSKATLDRNRYHATVYGDPVAKYYQDGNFFKGNGELISSADADIPDVPQESVDKAKAGTAKKQRAAKLKTLHVSRLKQIATELRAQSGAELPDMAGAGLKGRLVEYIAANTK